MSRVQHAGVVAILMVLFGVIASAGALKDGAKDQGGGDGIPRQHFSFYRQMVQGVVGQAVDLLYRPVRGAQEVGFLRTRLTDAHGRAPHVDAEAPLEFGSPGLSGRRFRRWLANEMPTALHQVRKGQAQYPQSMAQLRVEPGRRATRAGGIQRYVHKAASNATKVTEEGYCYLFEGGHRRFAFTREPRTPTLLSLAKGIRIWVKGPRVEDSPAGPLDLFGFDVIHHPWNRATRDTVMVVPFVAPHSPMFVDGYLASR